MSHFIAITGTPGHQKRAGKSIFASVLKEYFSKHCPEYEVVSGSFAESLRVVLCELYQISRSVMFSDDKDRLMEQVIWEDLSPVIRKQFPDKKGPLSLRELLQVFGTNHMRNGWSQDIWCNIPFEKYKFRDVIVIFDDARFENELRACKQHGGVNIMIKRDTGLQDAHESECTPIPSELITLLMEPVEGVEEYKEQAWKFIEQHKKGLVPNVHIDNIGKQG